MEPTSTVDSEESGKKINNMCNLSWLKHNAKSSPEIQDLNETPETSKKTKNGKKQKQKKSKTESAPCVSKDVNSIISDVDNEQNSKNQEKQKSTVLPITAITVANPPTVWNSNTDTAGTLFPDAQLQQVELEESLQLSKALEESIITAQLEKFRLTPEKNKINWADDSEEQGWGAVGKNLPEPSDVTNNKECEIKIEKKPHDDNNNSNNKLINEQNVKRIDKYGRVDGYAERHLFMGRGARIREEHFINQHTDRNMGERNQDQRNFRERNFNSFSNRNRNYRDFNEKNSYDQRYQIVERNSNDNRSSNSDDKREYRNKNFYPFNQRDNHYQSYRRDDQFHQRDNHFQRENQFHHQRNNQFYQRDNQSYHRDNQSYQRDTRSRYNYQRNENHSYENNSKRYGNSQKYDNQHSEFQYSNKDQNLEFSQEKELEPINVDEDNKESTPELQSNENSILEKNDSAKEEMEKPIEPIEINTCTSSSTLDNESSSLVFMQKSFKDDDDSDKDHASETLSEKSEDDPIVSSNPYLNNVPQIPFQMIHQPGIITNEQGNMQISNEMGFKLVANPFMTIPVSNTSQQHLPTESGCSLPIQNLDMRFFQHPVLHNPGNPYIPMMNYPMGMPIHSCQMSQVPVGNIQGINYMHQQPINCQQCPPHFCPSQRMPMQNINCQNPIYPAQFVTPITSVPLPMAPISPEQIQSIRHPLSGKISENMTTTPVTEIGKSVSNLVTLCESIPSRRIGLSNCPPGFENTIYAKEMQKKIIYNKEQELPTFRNNSKQMSAQQTSKKTEQFTVKSLNNMYQLIRHKQVNNSLKEEEDKLLHQNNTIKFTEGSYNERLFSSYEDNKTTKLNTQAPRPGFRIGVGRGKKLGPTT
ncbi:uncharacterized protein LOC127288104 [Leptopilina boulardi]|uniref:uncharacterized protein LOC127288104 n=1 Tax=Leptopilina boulardi TaxID=63433 RepID=UPI0021F605D0|nr:uncharacterized protein LOC127288104 [Leptopilina boulardi]XP_051171322.1 uncharacterized protein LOC127288104 [Leptopilina boulardi]